MTVSRDDAPAKGIASIAKAHRRRDLDRLVANLNLPEIRCFTLRANQPQDDE